MCHLEKNIAWRGDATLFKKKKKKIQCDKPLKAAKRRVLPHVMSEKATHSKCCNFGLHPSEQTSLRVQTETSTSGAQGP